jgi:hypothetical protein
MTRPFIGALILAGMCATAAAQQTAAPQPAPPGKTGAGTVPATEPSAPRPPEPSGQPVNIKLDLTIADQAGSADPAKKVISMIVADRQNGYIRSRGNVWTSGSRSDVTINVDARPTVLRDGNIRVELGLEYQPTPPNFGTTPPGGIGSSTNLNQRIGVILAPDRPLVVSQAVDAASDRRISVELRAAILK